MKTKAYSANLEFRIQFQIFRLTWRILTCKSWDTSEPMNAKIRPDASTSEALPLLEPLIDVGEDFAVVLGVLVPCNGKLSTFCMLGQTWKYRLSWFSRQTSHHITFSSSFSWPLAVVLSLKSIDFLHCIAMLVKVRAEVNSFFCFNLNLSILYLLLYASCSVISVPL